MIEQGAGNRRQATGNGNGKKEPATELRRGADIAERLLALAVSTLGIVRRLPRDVAGKHVASQIVRSATSAGANYEEARAAESRADFIHKVRVAAKELRETVFWLKLVQRSSLAPSTPLEAVVREANELTAILVTSARTARANSP